MLELKEGQQEAETVSIACGIDCSNWTDRRCGVELVVYGKDSRGSRDEEA